ncbi:hypothetical protein LTR98_011731 [Exophiala xenobiotica]|nr:hypothetical protein LTR98_011731 [Exophiala xenobiotica]
MGGHLQQDTKKNSIQAKGHGQAANTYGRIRKRAIQPSATDNPRVPGKRRIDKRMTAKGYPSLNILYSGSSDIHDTIEVISPLNVRKSDKCKDTPVTFINVRDERLIEMDSHIGAQETCPQAQNDTVLHQIPSGQRDGSILGDNLQETNRHHAMTSIGLQVDLAGARFESAGYEEEVSRLKQRLEATERNTREANAEIDRLSRILDAEREQQRQREARTVQRIDELEADLRAECRSWQHDQDQQRREKGIEVSKIARCHTLSSSPWLDRLPEKALLKGLGVLQDTGESLKSSKSQSEKAHEVSMSSVHTVEVQNTGSCDHAAITDNSDHFIQSITQMEELVVLRNKTALLVAEGGPLNAVRSICDHLKKVSLGEPTFCDEKHTEYCFVTDCGVLLCTTCLAHVLPDRNHDAAKAHDLCFEIHCPWCRKESWTWQKLPLPYSPSWAPELDHLIRIMGQLQQQMIQPQSGFPTP